MTKPIVSKDFNLEDIRKDLIRQLLKDMPESKNLLEYEDYRQHPTIGNASEFITQSLERNLDMAAMKENYVDYLVNRPHVERIGEHDLFTDAGKPVVLADIQREVVDHKGPVWTHVVSLRREDAARLGYDSIPTMVRELGMSRSIIKRALGDLVSAGYLKKEYQYRENGSHTSNLYTIL